MTDDRPPGATFAMRAETPDGTVIETVRDELGRVTTVRTSAGGTPVDRLCVEVGPEGTVDITRTDAGGTVQRLAPTSTIERTNPYGTTVSESDYGSVAVRRTYDDDGNLRAVTMSGEWGEQTTDLHPGGGRTVRWRTPLHHGTEDWDASGCRTRYEVRGNDGTLYRWERLAATTRVTVVGCDGTTAVDDTPEPDTGDEPSRR